MMSLCNFHCMKLMTASQYNTVFVSSYTAFIMKLMLLLRYFHDISDATITGMIITVKVLSELP